LIAIKQQNINIKMYVFIVKKRMFFYFKEKRRERRKEIDSSGRGGKRST
jgi:hypothetical protein